MGLKAAAISNIGKERFCHPSYHHVSELDSMTVRTLRDEQIGAHVVRQITRDIRVCYFGGVEADMNVADTALFHPLINVAEAPGDANDPYDQGWGEILAYGLGYYPLGEVSKA